MVPARHRETFFHSAHDFDAEKLAAIDYASRMRAPELLESVFRYLKEHPEELARALRNAVGLRFGVPLAALRWFAGQANGRRVPTDICIEAVPPGVRVAGTLEAMGSKVRASAVVFVEALQLDAGELRIELRVRDMTLQLLEGTQSPLAALISSGALDLSKIGNLVGALPKRPSFIREAKDDRIVLDLKSLPSMQGERAERWIGLITSVVTVTGVHADSEHLDFDLGVMRRGWGAAVDSWKNLL